MDLNSKVELEILNGDDEQIFDILTNKLILNANSEKFFEKRVFNLTIIANDGQFSSQAKATVSML